MYKKILVPVDLADTDLAKPAVTTAVEMAPCIGRIFAARQRARHDAGHVGRVCTA